MLINKPRYMQSQPSVLSIEEEEDDMVLHFVGGLVWVGFVDWVVRQVLVASAFGWVRLGTVGLGGFF
jgi:hypothetical protein